jgi:hypothetical protein
MQLVVAPGGQVRAIDSEEIAPEALGSPRVTRASSVEPDPEGRWHADLRPVRGPVLGPFARRSQALAAEVARLEGHWLTPGAPPAGRRPIPISPAADGGDLLARRDGPPRRRPDPRTIPVIPTA